MGKIGNNNIDDFNFSWLNLCRDTLKSNGIIWIICHKFIPSLSIQVEFHQKNIYSLH